MTYTKLNGTDITISKVALGTAHFGTMLDKNTSFMLLDSFAENGGNLLDTANIYANWLSDVRGMSEKTLGCWMHERKNRHEIIISTKGAHPENNVKRLGEAHIMKDIDESLQSLKTDYVDIYFLHRDDPDLPVAQIMETLGKLVVAGKVRTIGLSNWCPDRIKEAVDYCKAHFSFTINSSQIQFGVAHPNPDGIDPTTEFMTAKAYDFYSQADICLMAFSAQSQGFFFKENEFLTKAYGNEKSYEKAILLDKMASKYGAPKSKIITSALSCNPDFNTVPIIGGSTKEHILESMSGVNLDMDKADITALLARK